MERIVVLEDINFYKGTWNKGFMEGLENYEGRHLYDDGAIFVGVSSIGVNEHDLIVRYQDEMSSVVLQRGGLEGIARTLTSEDALQRLKAAGADEIVFNINALGVSVDKIAWACAKAFINDQEDRISKQSETLQGLVANDYGL